MFCNQFTIEDVKLMNSAFWTLHPYACDGVVIRNLNITARGHSAPNSDGIDPDSSRNVLVEDCFVDVGDDTVAIKSGMDYAGRQFAHPVRAFPSGLHSTVGVCVLILVCTICPLRALLLVYP
jgi:polygalacturonase